MSEVISYWNKIKSKCFSNYVGNVLNYENFQNFFLNLNDCLIHI